MVTAPLDCLSSASTSSLSLGWSYDANGNRLSQTGATPETHSLVSLSNQLASVTGGLSRSYTYDPDGHVLTDGLHTFTYNDSGRMSSVTISGSGGSTTTYLYNALGQRIEKAGPAGIEEFVYDQAGHLLGEHTGAGALIEETVWLGDLPVATIQPATVGHEPVKQ